jgi:hypothetical protein
MSPANPGGLRAALLFRPGASFDLALRLRREGAPLGEVFAFISGLYFRGKLAYSEAFADPPSGLPGAFVITSGRGLVPPDTVVTLDDLRQIAAVPIDATDPGYRDRDCCASADRAGPECSCPPRQRRDRHTWPSVRHLGDRLLFPESVAAAT